jgi:lipid A oxidase
MGSKPINPARVVFSSSPLRGEDSTARFSYFTKIEFAVRGGGDSVPQSGPTDVGAEATPTSRWPSSFFVKYKNRASVVLPPQGGGGERAERASAGWPERTLDRTASVLAITAFAVLAVSVAWPDTHVAASVNDQDKSAASPTTGNPGDFRSRLGAKDTRIGAYGGLTYTHPSDVKITKRPADPSRATDMTVKDVNWIGMPFKSPIYYGVRVQRIAPQASFGTMVDFTHAKAIAVNTQNASFEGTRDGKALPPKANIGETFRHLEFSHGHNMLTWNALFRMPAFWSKVRPYVGAGAGITLPHTEIGFRDEDKRTYEYQYAGLVGQVLGGVEINLGRTSVFVEYKFSYSPYEVPLSQEPRGFLLFTDLWRQFRAWATGEQPPGGRLATKLATQHAIAGMLVNLPGK